MPITIASNPASLLAQKNLSKATKDLSKTFERLSSGLRINRASDDPAGLALADALRNDTKLASVAIRNANDGISLVSIADNAFSAITDVLYRMSELASQSANGVYTNTQRSALQTEFESLGSEIERIAITTKFNGLTLLSASSDLGLQVGLDGSANSRINIASVLGTLQSLGLAPVGSSRLTFSIISVTSTQAQLAATTALDAITAAIGSVTAKRGVLGAAESRLNIAINNLSIARENFAAAESRIRDVDIAEETANLVRLQIIQQAATAILAQANQQPSVALRLLG